MNVSKVGVEQLESSWRQFIVQLVDVENDF